MAKAGDTNRVPAEMSWIYQSIVRLTAEFSASQLNDKYAALARRMAAALARKRPSPLWSGNLETWACGILYALGKINFLFDKAQAPHVRAEDLCSYLGVAASTGSAKAKVVLDHLRIRGHDPNWMLPSRLADHPLIWLVSINGLIVDIRHMPKEVQEVAYRCGIIPFVPGKASRVGDLVKTYKFEHQPTETAMLSKESAIRFSKGVLSGLEK